MSKEDNIKIFQEKLANYIKLSSVSAQNKNIKVTAEFLKKTLTELGGKVQVFDDQKFPLVFADFPTTNATTAQPTILFYNHYDVQPAEPLELWHSDPWTLTKKDGKLIGRGIADCKGDLFVRLTALKNYIDDNGQPPVHIKFLIEGAEEIASNGLESYFKKYADLFQTDLVIWESGSKNDQGQLTIAGGNKGICCFELSATSANIDLHSSYAAIVDGALWHLVDSISSLRDQGQIAIEGFYDGIETPSDRAKDLAHKMDLSPEKLAEQYQLTYPLIPGKEINKVKEAYLFSPSFNIEGISGGYENESVKTVLPKYGVAKFDIRLVPGQEPEDIAKKVQAQLKQNGFNDIKVEYTMGSKAYRSDMDDPLINTLIETAQTIYGGENSVEVLPTSAGTGPAYNFNHFLNAPIAAVGIGNPQSGAHAPNENVYEADYLQGIDLISQFFDNLTKNK